MELVLTDGRELQIKRCNAARSDGKFTFYVQPDCVDLSWPTDHIECGTLTEADADRASRFRYL